MNNFALCMLRTLGEGGTTLWCHINQISVEYPYPTTELYDKPLSPKWSVEQRDLKLQIQGVLLNDSDLDLDTRSKLLSKITMAMLAMDCSGDILVYDNTVYDLIIETVQTSDHCDLVLLNMTAGVVDSVKLA